MLTAETDAPTQPVRDVAEFHLRWPEFRDDMMELVRNRELNQRQRETLLWLVRLADRVGGRDLQS